VSCIFVYMLGEKEYWNAKWKKIIVPVLFISSMCLGFFIYPIDAVFSSTMSTSKVDYKLPLDLLYEAEQEKKPAVDLRQGKHVIAYLSLTCMHCRIAATKMQIMYKKNPSIPFYFVINGNPEKLAAFFEETHAASIPHSLFLGPEKWIRMAGISLPVIMLVENGMVKKKFNGMELNQADIEAWLNK